MDHSEQENFAGYRAEAIVIKAFLFTDGMAAQTICQ
jgi:hypothetical protein